MRTTSIKLFTLASAVFLLTACLDSTTSVDEGLSITEITLNSPNFSVLANALIQTDLAETLDNSGPFTVFAPDNDAFGSLPDGLLDDLSDEQLTEILLYHVISSNIFSLDLDQEQSVETVNGDEMFITTTGTGIQVNNSAAVYQVDVVATNGVMHAIDGVLLPDSYLDVTGVASKRYFLSSFANAIDQANLLDTFQNPEANFTVFAPTNDAFFSLPGGTIEGLTEQELQNILLYHVVDTRIFSGDLSEGTHTLETLSGDTIEVVFSSGVITVNGNAVVQSFDLNGTNGVVHSISNVLIP